MLYFSHFFLNFSVENSKLFPFPFNISSPARWRTLFKVFCLVQTNQNKVKLINQMKTWLRKKKGLFSIGSLDLKHWLHLDTWVRFLQPKKLPLWLTAKTAGYMGKPEWHSRLKINCYLPLCNMLISVWVMWKAVLMGLFQLLLQSMRCGGRQSNLTLPKNCACDSNSRLSGSGWISTSWEVSK